MSSECRLRCCGGGCCRKGCGGGDASGSHIANGESDGGTLGELVQMDGSFHDWLEEGGPDGCMMNMVDDATSEVELRLGEEETIWAAANTLRAWIEKHGVPQAL